jgi:ATP-dependent RNA helicase DeaD
MLVRQHRAALPQPEELIEATPEAQRAAQQDRHRPGFEDVVWFRMDIGRRQNADPRWILPLLCRRGHITKGEIGAIRIAPTETWFQVPRGVAGKFAAAVARTAGADDDGANVRIEQSDRGPEPSHRGDRGAPSDRGGPRRPNAGPPRGRPPQNRAGPRPR